MAVSTRIIKQRLKSIKNTRKITKAMELVAASKMRKAIQLTLASREYSRKAKKLVDDVRILVNPSLHAMLSGGGERRATERVRSLVIVAASDRSMCGGFNAQLLKKALEFLKGRANDEIRIITVGRKAEAAVRRTGQNVLASFEAISNAPSFGASQPIGKLAVTEFIEQRADRVFIAYTDFKSALTQIPTIEQLLPVIPEAELSTIQQSNDQTSDSASTSVNDSSVLFEPNASYVLNHLLPRLIETRVYQALLESSASEQSARMMAMRSATDNATGMIDDLTFTFNQARQAGITREISEISAGKAALE
jgi:F-type H+-transporting ATPase subunit gamma